MAERQRGISFQSPLGIIGRGSPAVVQIKPNTIISKNFTKKFLMIEGTLRTGTRGFSYTTLRVQNNAGIPFIAINDMLIARINFVFNSSYPISSNRDISILTLSIKRAPPGSSPLYDPNAPEIIRISPPFSPPGTGSTRSATPATSTVTLTNPVLVEAGSILFVDILSVTDIRPGAGLYLTLEYFSG